MRQPPVATRPSPPCISASPPRHTAIPIFAVLILSALLAGCGPRDASIQGTIRDPNFSMRSIAPTKSAASDWRSRQFQSNDLPKMIGLATQRFTRESIAANFAELVLDPTRLQIAFRTNVRVYFVGEESGYLNSLGVNTKSEGTSTGTPLVVFPEIAANHTIVSYPELMDPKTGRLDLDKFGPRTEDAPLIPGDFVDLGTFEPGTRLSFFLHGFDGSRTLGDYVANPDQNPDRLDHIVAIAVSDSPYLLLGFEDMLGGGDRDYDDCVFVVEMSKDNIAALLGKLDPWRRFKQGAAILCAVAVVLGVPTSIAAARRRARQKRQEQARKRTSQLLAAGQFAEALAVIRNAKEDAVDQRNRHRWAELEVKALNGLDDVGRLCDSFEAQPDVFRTDETAALVVGRAQAEFARFESFETLRQLWRGHETMRKEWAFLDADVLACQSEDLDAISALEEVEFSGKEDAGRLARVGLLRSRIDLVEGQNQLMKAAEIDPQNPDVRFCWAQFHEAQGQFDEAQNAYRAALKCRSQNAPFIRDRLADLLVRRGQYQEALHVWHEGLGRPSLDVLWLKVLFWSRVAQPIQLPPTDALPSGYVRPIVDFLLALSPDEFWDTQAFDPIAQHRPELLSRQEVFWLRVLQSVKIGDDVGAQTLLSVSGFGVRSWNAPLENALRRILTYRRRRFLGPPSTTDWVSPHPARNHPFFVELETGPADATSYCLPEVPDRLLRGPFSIPAACLAVGWKEAASKLLAGMTHIPDELPDWLKQELKAVLNNERETQPGSRSRGGSQEKNE